MEITDRVEPVTPPTDPSGDGSQTKNNVLELSFKTRRHFVFCSTATSPRRKPILGLSQGQGLRKQDPQPLQEVLANASVALPLTTSSSAMFLDDHDYSSSAKRGRGLETGSCTIPILPQPVRQKPVIAAAHSGTDSIISQVSTMMSTTELVLDDIKPMHMNPMSDLMQAMCEEVLQVECSVAAEKICARSNDTQGIYDMKSSESHISKSTEVTKFLTPSAFTVKVQKVDAHKESRTIGLESGSTSTHARNHILRASWSSTSNKQSSIGRTNRCVTSTSYSDIDASHGVKVGPSTSKYQLFKVDMGASSTTTSSLSTFCDDKAPLLTERPACGSLDGAQTGMILPSPFLLQTGLEKTLDFAEFRPMSPSNRDWDNEWENGCETTLFEQEIVRTCDMSGVSAFDGQDFPTHQNLFSSPPASVNCVRTQQSLCSASDIKTTIARSKQINKWSGKKQEHLKVTFDPLTLENAHVRRRKAVKRQLDFGSPVEMAEETVSDADRKRARHNPPFNKTTQEKREVMGNGTSSADETQKSRRPRKSKKVAELGMTGNEDLDQKLYEFEKMNGRHCKRYRLKPELGVSNNKDDASAKRDNDSTNDTATEQERHFKPSVTQQKVPKAHRSVDFSDVLTTMLDRWLEYLMTPSDVMRRQAIDDARSFGYNDDALDMVSNGDLEVWRILEDMEPDFVRSGLDKYFT